MKFLLNQILCRLTHLFTHWCLQPSVTWQWMWLYTGLISSLFNIASSQDVPFCQPQDVQCMHHGLTFVLLCVPVLFADKGRCQFVIARYGFPQAVREFHSYFLYRVYPSFLYCSSFVRLCNKRSIVKNEVQQTTSLSARNLLLGHSDAKLLLMYTWRHSVF